MSSTRKHLTTSLFISLLFLMLVIGVSVGSPPTCPPSQCKIGNKCCLLCPPGNYVKTDCTAGRNISCRPCESGTYMDSPTCRRECFPCTQCDPGSGLKVNSSCTTTVDTVCEPWEGFFCANQTGDRCTSAQRHTVCQPGQYIQKKGTALTDTVCSNCSTGTFSNGTFTTCRAHTQCEKLNLAGTNSSDAQCGENHLPLTAIVSIAIVVVSVVVLGGVGVGGVFYLWKSRKCGKGEKNKYNEAQRVSENNLGEEYIRMTAV